MSTWLITDNEGRLDMTFTPILDRADKTDALIISTDQHQVFGMFNGTATLDDDTVLNISNALGFAEKVKNKW